jgi:hypothetical protein
VAGQSIIIRLCNHSETIAMHLLNSDHKEIGLEPAYVYNMMSAMKSALNDAVHLNSLCRFPQAHTLAHAHSRTTVLLFSISLQGPDYSHTQKSLKYLSTLNTVCMLSISPRSDVSDSTHKHDCSRTSKLLSFLSLDGFSC